MHQLKIFMISLVLIFVFCTPERKDMTAQKEDIKKYKLAMIQMEVEGGKRGNNFKRAFDRIEEAAQNGAQIAVLPEVMDLGWCHSSAKTKASEIPDGIACDKLCWAALKNKLYIVAGITEKEEEYVYNTTVLIDPRGEVLLKHRKINELQIGHHLYSPGDRLNVIDTDLGRIGLLICADANANGYALSKSLGIMGADLILSPCAWAVEPDHDNKKDPYGAIWREAYSTISKEFGLWFVGVSNVGKVTDGAWKGWNCIGCSLAFNDEGNELVQGPYGVKADTILYIDIHRNIRPEWRINN